MPTCHLWMPFGEMLYRSYSDFNEWLRTIRLFGAGFRTRVFRIYTSPSRYSGAVVAFGPSGDAGVDRLTIRIPSSLRDAGEADLVCSIHGRLSNVVRINLGHGNRPQ